jgi:hypothetical protein
MIADQSFEDARVLTHSQIAQNFFVFIDEIRRNKTGTDQWRVVVRGNAAANVVLVRVADASPAATPQKNVDVFVLEMGLAVWE